MELIEFIRQENGCQKGDVCYQYYKVMPDGNIAYLNKLAFTWGLHLGADQYTAYVNRFCFPDLTNAIKAFESCNSIWDIPDFGWVAARPEGRLLLPRDLISFSSKENFELLKGHNQLFEIDRLIEDGLYTRKEFDKWLKRMGFKINSFDKGVQSFYEKLPK